jgi:hypothetical protein
MGGFPPSHYSAFYIFFHALISPVGSGWQVLFYFFKKISRFSGYTPHCRSDVTQCRYPKNTVVLDMETGAAEHRHYQINIAPPFFVLIPAPFWHKENCKRPANLR